VGVRKSDFFWLYLLVNILLLLGMGIHSSYRQKEAQTKLAEGKELVRSLELTDLCLFTEANYTRHLTQADWHVPFQDHPVSLEHFPSGSLLGPPAMLKRIHDRMD
jgi:hypothetical protein